MRSSWRNLIIIGLIVCLFAAALIHLMVMRFRTTDIYPPYSSFRSDPIGVKALHDSLSGLGGLSVERNVEALEDLASGAGSTLLILGEDPPRSLYNTWLPRSTAESLEHWVREGGRLVIAYSPMEQRDGFWKEVSDERQKNQEERDNSGAEKKEKAGDKKAKKEKVDKQDEEYLRKFEARMTSMTNWMGLAFHAPAGGVKSSADRAANAPAGLPSKVACHTDLCFTNQAIEWSVLYKRGSWPVVIEKKLGRGSVVLTTVSFFVSNEGLKTEREPGLLAWLVGPSEKIIFDETHLGLHKDESLAQLFRKRGLFWAIAAALLTGILFVWRNSLPLAAPVPAATDGADIESAEGKGSLSGLVNLLKQNLPARKSVETCFDEWRKIISVHRLLPPGAIDKLQTYLLARSGHEAARSLYNNVTELLGVMVRTGKLDSRLDARENHQVSRTKTTDADRGE